MYSDAHIHLFDTFNETGETPYPLPGSVMCASAHAEAEFAWQESFGRVWPGQVRLSFGIHPQEPNLVRLDFLEQLAGEGRISAVGECGFDLFTEGYRETLDAQIRAWDAQLSIAREARLPLVVHCRKAIDRIFADTQRLKGLTAVIFHGWPGSVRDAESLLERGINAYFSVGKGLLRGNRALRESVQSLPLDRLLTETDAPWMTLKGERASIPADIRAVTAEAASIREIDKNAFEAAVYANFIAAFGENP